MGKTAYLFISLLKNALFLRRVLLIIAERDACMVLEIFKSILMGIVQGVTEWLPISSTGHMLLLDQFLHITVSPIAQRNQDFFDVYKVVIQLGSILAVLVLYFQRLNPFSAKKSAAEKKETLFLWLKVLIASIPAGIAGILFDEQIDGVLATPYVISAALIFYGFLFIIAEGREREPRINDLSRLDGRTVFGIGVWQMLALVPGTSRSGATKLGGLLLGCSRLVAVEFSFFMAIPAMFGGSAIRLLKFAVENGEKYGGQYPALFSGVEWAVLLAGFVVAFVVSIGVIRFLLNFIKKHDFKAFGYYRIALGLLVLAYFGIIAR
jgi:undecaprenyl-diphosphatase